MSRSAWLVLIVTLAAVAGIFVAADMRDHRAFDTSRHPAAATTKGGIDLKSVLSLQQRGDLLTAVATITIQNKTDKPVMYVGQPCYAPAQAAFRSTLQPPTGPSYLPAAAALRAHVMDYRRTLDQIGYFEPSTSHIAELEPCDGSAPPMLPPNKTIVYSMSQFVGTSAEPDFDSATTDVVTTLRLGSLPKSWTGHFPPPVQVVDTIEVRTPLSAVIDLSRQSSADYGQTAQRFDLVMNDPRVAAWVDAQDPALWRDARLTPTYRPSRGWQLLAFHHAWATPLYVEGNDGALTVVRIPTEPRPSPPWTDAVLPPDTSTAATLELPYRDVYVGDLVLPSGEVMVGDGFASDNEVLFDFGLRPGSYPIHIVTAKPLYRAEEYEFVAWEELVLSSNPVTRWQPAVPVGHTAQELKPGETFTFGTDGGGGGFASPEAMKFVDAAISGGDDPISTALGEREEANDWLWAIATVDPKTGANVFVTTTGGDGGFPVLMGLDAQNRPALLLSDFGGLQMTYSGLKLYSAGVA